MVFSWGHSRVILGSFWGHSGVPSWVPYTMVLMRLDCGHSSDTFSLCHTVCQQQAPHANDHDDDDGEGDDDDEEEGDDDEEEGDENECHTVYQQQAPHANDDDYDENEEEDVDDDDEEEDHVDKEDEG